MSNKHLAAFENVRSVYRRLAKMAEPARAVFRSGSVTGDVWSLVSKYVPSEERAAALHRLARGKYISPYFADPRVRGVVGRTLVHRLGPEEARKHIQDEILPNAILKAVQARHEARRIRLGRQWVKDELGNRCTTPATGLLLGEFAQWVRQEAKNVAEARILKRGEDALEHTRSLVHDPRDPAYGLDGSKTSEDSSEGDLADLLPGLRSRLSPREREVLDHLRRTPGASLADVAAVMGIRPSTARAFFHRIKTKGRSQLLGQSAARNV